MRAVAQEGQERSRGRRMKDNLRDELGKKAGNGGRGRDVTMLEALLLSGVVDAGGAHRVPGGDGGKGWQSCAACQQRQDEHTAQANTPGELAAAAEMGTSDHKRYF